MHLDPGKRGRLKLAQTVYDLLTRDEHPIVGVTWYDARAYCRWRGKDLSTWVQWEVAAREPDKPASLCAWGQEFESARANTRERHDEGSGTPLPFPVSRGLPGSRDLVGMAGNVSEWTREERADSALLVGGNYQNAGKVLAAAGRAGELAARARRPHRR